MSNSKGYPTASDLRKLVERQHYKCAMSGRVLTPETAACDHVVPLKNGGTHAIDNLQILHRDINRMKGTLASEEFIALCCEIAEHAGQSERGRQEVPQRQDVTAKVST